MCQGQLNLCNNEQNEKRHVNSLFYTTSCTVQIMYVLLTKHFSYTRVSHNRAHFKCNSSQAQLVFFMYVKITKLSHITPPPPPPPPPIYFFFGWDVYYKISLYVAYSLKLGVYLTWENKLTLSVNTTTGHFVFRHWWGMFNLNRKHNPVHQQEILLWVWDSAKWVYTVNMLQNAFVWVNNHSGYNWHTINKSRESKI